MRLLDLQGKVILITGASSGIGKAAAYACAEQGARLVLLGRNKQTLQNSMSLLPGKGHCYKAFDLQSDENYDVLFQEIVSDVGKLNGLVYSAGIPGVIPLKVLSKQKMLEIMNVNFFSFVEMVKQYSKKKYSEGGSIVGVSSVVVERGELCQTIYAASKASMEAAVKCLAIELADKNIRINTVMPGMIQTNMMKKVVENGSDIDKLGAGSVLGIGTPEEVANAILFLLSNLSSHTTGRTVYVDGGCFL